MRTATKPSYCITAYDITNPDLFRQYPPRVLALLPKYGGRVLASGTSPYVLEASPDV